VILPNIQRMEVMEMVLQDCYKISVDTFKQKFIPLMQAWGWKVAEEEDDRSYICRLSNPEGNHDLSLEIERLNTFIILHSETGMRSIYPEIIPSKEELKEKVWKFFRCSIERFVTELVWLHAPRDWQKRRRRLFRRRGTEILALTFSLGKRTWKWEVVQVIYPVRRHYWGCPEVRKLGVVRCPAHQDPVAAGLSIISVEGLAYL
jgi:hypothetical protein